MQKAPENANSATAETPNPAIAGFQKSRHSLAEDVFAIAIGTALVSFGVFLYQQSSLVLGGLAGVSLILDYLTPFGFGIIFFAINLPFYLFGVGRLGWGYIIRTFAAVTAMSLMVRFLPLGIDISGVHPLVASTMGGAMIGLGPARPVPARRGAWRREYPSSPFCRKGSICGPDMCNSASTWRSSRQAALSCRRCNCSGRSPVRSFST